MLRIPSSLRKEHEEIMQSLRIASKMNDETGNAVRELMKSLEPHFEKEEKYAMPALGALPELVSGDKIRDLKEIADLQGALLQEYETMFQEHEILRRWIEQAKKEAYREHHEETVDLLDALAHHAKVEEEVLYPAALLAGTLAKFMLPNANKESLG